MMSNVSLGALSNSYVPDASALDAGGGDSGGVDFGAVLKNAVHGVNQTNDDVTSQVTNLLQGSGSSDVNSVMIAVEKADVSFQLMMQVRNKIVSAYQDIEKMQF
jgi:flagellar hook-basal body complex protein FliE